MEHKSYMMKAFVVFLFVGMAGALMSSSLKLLRVKEELREIKEHLAQKEKERALKKASYTKQTAAMEEVNAFPEEYAGQVLVFERATLDGYIKRGEDFFWLSVTSRSGKYMGGGSSSNFSFVVSSDFGRILVQELNPSGDYLARLTCRMERLKQEWVANVSRLDICSSDGRILSTITESGLEHKYLK